MTRNTVHPGKSGNTTDDLIRMLAEARAAERDQGAGLNADMRERLNLSEALASAMREAKIAQPMRARTAAGFQEPTSYIPANMARGVPACMKTANLPAAFDKDGRLRNAPKAAPVGTVLTMDRAVIANSRVAAAGAHVLVLEDNRRAHAVGKTAELAMERLPVEFRTVETANFETVDIDSEAEVALASLPVNVARLDWNNAITKGVRFSATRSELRLIGDEEFCDEVAIALALGAARAADEALLSAIQAAAPTEFTLAKAAAAGLKFDELRALVGTSGTGATVSPNGALRASGIGAELTADMAGTLAGAFDRSAVAIRDDFDIQFLRKGLTGGLEVVAWINLLPLVPDAGKFWTIAA